MFKKLKEFKEIIAVVVYLGALVGLNISSVNHYVCEYIIYAVLFLLFIDYMIYTVNSKSSNNRYNDIRCDVFKKEVRDLISKLKNIDKISYQHTIDYIYELEERRKMLGINSKYQAMLEELMSRIEF